MLLKERTESLIKYISSMRNFIKNQVYYHKRRIILLDGKRNCAIAKNIAWLQNAGRKE